MAATAHRGRAPLYAGVGIVVAASLTAPVFAVLRDVQTIPTPVLIASPLTAIVAGVLAVLIARRDPGNRIAWMLLAVGAAGTLTWFGSAFVDWSVGRGGTAHSLGERMAAVVDAAWIFHATAIGGLVTLFPDGRLPGPRWRRPALVFVTGIALTFLLGVFAPGPLPAPYASSASPLGVRALASPKMVADAISPPLLLVPLLAAVYSVRVRLGRASGLERLQIRWLALAALLAPITLVTVLVEQLSFGEVHVAYVLGVLTLSAILGAVGVAVLRYRLYEIDRLISRTLVYVPLTALLVGAWAAIAVGAGALVGGESRVATAAATVGAALAFGPLRRRLQHAVDRRFNRPGLEALRRIERFGVEVREDRAAPERIESELAAALGDRRLSLRYRVASDGRYVDAHGRPADAEPPPGLVMTTVERQGVELGVVFHDEILRERGELFARILLAGGLPIEIARLRADVALQVESVRAARARADAAETAERGRVRAELDAGAGVRLAALEQALDRATDALGGEDPSLAETLSAASGELQHTRAELDTLIGGYAPKNLGAGLAPALRDLAGRMPLAVGVRAELPLLPDEPERTAYFVCAEALTNASKHSGAWQVEIVARLAQHRLYLRINDNGGGGASFVSGGGLCGLRDRVHAAGGRLNLSSGARGTTVEAELPCAS